MHDEAAAHYVDMVDQTTLGHGFIADQFGPTAVPTTTWQLDPFGHSATQVLYSTTLHCMTIRLTTIPLGDAGTHLCTNRIGIGADRWGLYYTILHYTI